MSVLLCHLCLCCYVLCIISLFLSISVSDFFDAGPAADDAAAMETSETDSPVTHQVVMETSEPPAEQLITDESKPMAEKLPEGFFDDPVKDAKVVYLNQTYFFTKYTSL